MAEGSGLLNRQSRNVLVGSNPTSSASTENNPLGLFSFVRARGCGIRTERRGPSGPTRVGVERVS